MKKIIFIVIAIFFSIGFIEAQELGNTLFGGNINFLYEK